MMKYISIFISFLFLTSCHLGDHRPEIHEASVSIINDNICITLPDTKNESMSYMKISELGNSEKDIIKRFSIEKAPKLYPNECLSSYGFTFESGKTYIFVVRSIRIKKDHTTKSGNSYGVTFSVWTDNGKLKAKDINSCIDCDND